jgi:hypothetical protein
LDYFGDVQVRKMFENTEDMGEEKVDELNA